MASKTRLDATKLMGFKAGATVGGSKIGNAGKGAVGLIKTNGVMKIAGRAAIGIIKTVR